VFDGRVAQDEAQRVCPRRRGMGSARVSAHEAGKGHQLTLDARWDVARQLEQEVGRLRWRNDLVVRRAEVSLASGLAKERSARPRTTGLSVSGRHALTRTSFGATMRAERILRACAPSVVSENLDRRLRGLVSLRQALVSEEGIAPVLAKVVLHVDRQRQRDRVGKRAPQRAPRRGPLRRRVLCGDGELPANDSRSARA